MSAEVLTRDLQDRRVPALGLGVALEHPHLPTAPRHRTDPPGHSCAGPSRTVWSSPV